MRKLKQWIGGCGFAFKGKGREKECTMFYDSLESLNLKGNIDRDEAFVTADFARNTGKNYI